MTKDEARKLVGRAPKWILANMAFALSLHPWLNDENDWRRLEAAVVVLGKRAPERAVDILNGYKARRAFGLTTF
jgi:hypothetical protein